MRIIILILTLSFFALNLSAQEQKSGEKNNKIVIKEKSEIKSVDKTIRFEPEEKKDNNSELAPNGQPIILRLEYNENASNNNQQVENNTKVEPVKVDEKNIEEEIRLTKLYIQAIEKKINYVKNNPEADKYAKENGWYDRMEKNIVESNLKLDNLKNQNK